MKPTAAAPDPLPTSESDPGDLGFAYRVRKTGEVEVRHHGRLAATLRGAQTLDFLAEARSGSPLDAQQLMARTTGNYKRGNERAAGNHPRNKR